VVSGNPVIVEWKPVGRGRRFDRMARGLARRLRLPFVRSTLWELEHPLVNSTTTYSSVWTSTTTLANFSFACTCHKRERYSRKGEKRRWRA
jgi:hypothetical protein